MTPPALRKVLLTGGTGFVGGHLAEALVASGVRPRCLVRPQSSYEGLAALGADLACGGLDDPESLAKAAQGCDAVFHVAGKTKVRRPREYMRANAEGTSALVSAVEEASPEATFLYVSSLAAAGPSPDGRPLNEEDPARPVSLYGKSKLTGEQAVRRSRLKWVIIRPPAVYGPRDTDVYSFFKLASLGLSPVVGGVERSLSLVHVLDLAQGLILAAGAKPGSVYFMSDPEPYPLGKVMETIAGVLGKRLRRFKVPYCVVRPAAWLSEGWAWARAKPVIFSRDKLREMEQAHWVCSPAKALQELGFSPAYPLSRGVEQTAAWYKEHGWL